MFAIEHKIQENPFRYGRITVTPTPSTNALLRLLQQTAPERLADGVWVRLNAGPWSAHAAGDDDGMYFPEDCLLGLSTQSAVRQSPVGPGVRLAVLGCHQVWVPGSAQAAGLHAQVLVPGHALRVPQALLDGAGQPLAAWRLQVAAGSQQLMAQMARMTLCAQRHSPSASLASWLLMARHHCRGDALQIPMTAWRDWLGLSPEVWDSAWQTLLVGGGVARVGEEAAAGIQVRSPGRLADLACACHQTACHQTPGSA